MEFDKISFRPTEEQRKFFEMLSKKYGINSHTKLMHRFVDDARSMMGFTSSNPANQGLSITDSSVKTFQDHRVSDGDPMASIFALAKTNPIAAHAMLRRVKRAEEDRRNDEYNARIEEQEKRADAYEESRITRRWQQLAETAEAFNRFKRAWRGF